MPLEAPTEKRRLESFEEKEIKEETASTRVQVQWSHNEDQDLFSKIMGFESFIEKRSHVLLADQPNTTTMAFS